MAVVAMAAAIAMHPITRSPAPEPILDASPHGYTWSLALFVLPVVAILVWLVRFPKPDLWKPLTATAGVVLPTYFLLDILFGRTFFTFPNSAATVRGAMVWGYRWGEGWDRTIPMEEFLFYTFGFLAILLYYAWCSWSWLGLYHIHAKEGCDDAPRKPLVRFEGRWLLVVAGVFGLALLGKKLGPHPEGFPGYFLFMVAVIVVPCTFLYRGVRPLVNVPAFMTMIQALLFVSLLWEVTLGLPYGYWGYNPEQMIGIQLRPWSNLPIEEPLLWFTAGWANVTILQVFRIRFATGRPLREILFGYGTPAATAKPGEMVKDGAH
jgi:lycopene cyclase domain-containing protein